MRQAIEDWKEHRRAQAVTGLVKREWPVIAWLISFILIAFGIWQVAALQDQMREDLIGACQTTREPLHNYFQDELAATALTKAKLFPDIPRDEFDELMALKVSRIEAVLTVFDPAKCAGLYER